MNVIDNAPITSLSLRDTLQHIRTLNEAKTLHLLVKANSTKPKQLSLDTMFKKRKRPVNPKLELATDDSAESDSIEDTSK